MKWDFRSQFQIDLWFGLDGLQGTFCLAFACLAGFGDGSTIVVIGSFLRRIDLVEIVLLVEFIDGKRTLR